MDFLFLKIKTPPLIRVLFLLEVAEVTLWQGMVTGPEQPVETVPGLQCLLEPLRCQCFGRRSDLKHRELWKSGDSVKFHFECNITGKKIDNWLLIFFFWNRKILIFEKFFKEFNFAYLSCLLCFLNFFLNFMQFHFSNFFFLNFSENHQKLTNHPIPNRPFPYSTLHRSLLLFLHFLHWNHLEMLCFSEKVWWKLTVLFDGWSRFVLRCVWVVHLRRITEKNRNRNRNIIYLFLAKNM